MPISHELSGEIAAALLADKDRTPRELEELKETLLLVHSTLQKLTDDEQNRRGIERATRIAAAGGTQ